MKRHMLKTLISLILLFAIASCVPIVVTGAAAGAAGSTVIYDKRSLQAINNDQKIAYGIKKMITANTELSTHSDIKVTSFNAKVLLVGYAKTATLKNKAGRIASNYDNVVHVYNEILINPPISLKEHMSDSWINARVKSKLLTNQGLESTQIKITTYHGAVFLMGEVTPMQGSSAIELARQVKGVTRVIDLFDYVDNELNDYESEQY